MTKQLSGVFVLGLVVGVAAIIIGGPSHAVAENPAGGPELYPGGPALYPGGQALYSSGPGLYQIQASGALRPGVSNIWRLNTVTGQLDFCTFANISPAGPERITCQASNMPSKR